MPAPTRTYYGTESLELQPGSPVISWGEKVTHVLVYRGQWAAVQAGLVPKYTLGTGDQEDLWVVGCRATRGAGFSSLEISYETVPGADNPSGGTPPESQYAVEFDETKRKLEYHPAYDELTKEQKTAVRELLDATEPTARDRAKAVVNASALTTALYEKLLRGQDTYVLGLPTITVTAAYAGIPSLSGGGYIDTPPGTIEFTGSWVWLRMPDQMQWDGSFWQVTSRWRGALDWDTDIY